MAHNLALICTPILFWIGVKIHQWYLAKHSPSGEANPMGGVKPQVTANVTPVDPTPGLTAGEGKTIYRPTAEVDVWLAQQAPARRTNDLIREATRRFKVSASTVKRKLRRMRHGGDA